MKHFLLFLLIIFISNISFAQNGRISLQSSSKKQSLVNGNFNGFSVSFSFDNIESRIVNSEKGYFSDIFIDGLFSDGEIGSPALPAIHKLIAIPEGATAEISFSEYSSSEYNLSDYGINKIAPKQVSVRKDKNPSEISFAYNETAYLSSTYSANSLEGSISYIGSMRGVNIGLLEIRPVVYNPLANKIKVFNNIVAEVSFSNANVNQTKSVYNKMYSSPFVEVYNLMLNKDLIFSSTVKYDGNNDLYQTPVRMMVVAPSSFESSLQPWLEWKTQKGFYITTKYYSSKPSAATVINDIKAEYDGENSPTYVVVVGDVSQIPASTSYNISGDGTFYSDLLYATIGGSDNVPDVYYSRMSAENVSQLDNIVSKILTYEKYTMDDPSYLDKCLLIAGYDDNDSPSWTKKVGVPTINYGLENYFNQANGWGDVTVCVGSSYTSTATAGKINYNPLSVSTNTGTNVTIANLWSNITNGVGFINYTAHGDVGEWSGPNLTSGTIANYNNADKYFVAIGNCCLSGNFATTENTGGSSTVGSTACFGESLIRQPNKGAVSYIGSVPSTYWCEDFYWSVGAHSFSAENYPSVASSSVGVYDGMNLDANWNSLSSWIMLGNLSVALAHSSNYESDVNDLYYWRAYHVIGDGSIMPYLSLPLNNHVSIESVAFLGISSLDVAAEPGSYVAISQNNILLGVGVVPESGIVTVNFSELTSTDDLLVVVTRQQYAPYIENIHVTEANQPYVTILDYSPKEVNFGETEYISLTIKNNGDLATSGLSSVTISCSDSSIFFTDFTEYFDVVNPTAELFLSNAFSMIVSDDIEDNHSFTVTANIVNGNYTWVRNMTFVAKGPICSKPDSFSVVVTENNIDLSWSITNIEADTIFDNFENHTAFEVNSSGSIGWMAIDGDNAASYNFSSLSFLNEGSEMAYIIMDKNGLSGSQSENINAYSGSQFLAFVAIEELVNNDWIVSPELNFVDDFTFSFYARSAHSDYQTEKFKIAYSLTGNDENDFTYLFSNPVTTTTNWTKYTYSIPASAKYVAINCVSNDQYLLCIDDISFIGNKEKQGGKVNIYHNDEILATNVLTETYSISNVADGYHCYSLKNICADGTESASTVDSCFIIGSVASYSINISTTNGGTVDPIGNTIVFQGQNFTFKILPDLCYIIDSVVVNGEQVSISSINTYTISNIASDYEVNVYFGIKSYMVFASAGENGTISPSGNNEVRCGENITFTIVAAANYEVSSLLVDGNESLSALTNENTYTFTNVANNHTVEAAFTPVSAILEPKYENVQLFPNPASSLIRMILPVENCTIEIFDIIGNNVLSFFSSSKIANVNISCFSTGLYFVKINNGESIVNVKFVKE